MNSQAASTWTAAGNAPKANNFTLLSRHFIGERIESEDCGPISDMYFWLLMALVVAATFAFGCVVHG